MTADRVTPVDHGWHPRRKLHSRIVLLDETLDRQRIVTATQLSGSLFAVQI